MRRFGYTFLFIILTFFLIYLLLPNPSRPPSLPDSVKSTEEGDTVQIPGVSAYYSNKTRDQVTKFYGDFFSKSPFLQMPLPTIRLNHPPEYARLVIRDQILTSYLVEYVRPFRDSLFVNGWEPDVYFAANPVMRSQHQIYLGEKKYFSKTTLRSFQSSIAARMALFSFAIGLFWLFYRLSKRIIQTGVR